MAYLQKRNCFQSAGYGVLTAHDANALFNGCSKSTWVLIPCRLKQEIHCTVYVLCFNCRVPVVQL